LKAVILAAGEGVRMRPLTYTRPKVMLPIANKPILEHLVIEAKNAGIEEFIFIVGYHDEHIRNYFGNGEKWSVNIEHYSQRRQLGTADALRMAEGLVDDKFLVLNGDIVVGRQEIARLMKMNDTTMCVIEAVNPCDLGVVEVEKGMVVHIHEKMAEPPSCIANTGLYLFTSDIFNAIAKTPESPRGEYELTDSIQIMIDSGQPVNCQEIKKWYNFSYPWDLLTANDSLISTGNPENQGNVEENVVLKGEVSIGNNTVVRAGSYIVGPVVIGENCEIGPNCYIRPVTAIGDNCHIGANVEVKNSIVMQGSKIPHHNYVGDSIIGEDCNLGAGTKIANLKMDKKPVTIAGVDTGLRKLGAIIGDNVQVGINASINVGCMIGNNTLVGPGALAHGVIAPRSKIL